MTTPTLYTGTNIAASATDVLQPVSELQLLQLIQHADGTAVEMQHQLKRMLTVDSKAAANIKKRFPYFIGASFKNNLRHVNNFLQLDYFVLDFDHLPFDAAEIENIKQKISKDEHLLLAFISPSGKGIKCVFKLKTPATNTMQFSAFYKSFAFDFAKKYQLSDFVDYATCDVTRVCFIASDATAIYNAAALPVECKNTAAVNSDKQELFSETPETETVQSAPAKPVLDQSIYKQLVKRLDPQSYTVAKPKQVYVPAELHLIHHLIEDALAHYNFKIKETRDINYGKKYVVLNNLDIAELNIYFGKNGYQVVKSPKSGTNPEFNEACFHIINQAIFKSSDLHYKNTVNTERNNGTDNGLEGEIKF